MLFQIIQNNYACFMLCILFLLFVITDRSFHKRIEILFLIAAGIVFLLTIVDNLELLEAQKTYATVARSVYSAVGYSLRPAVAIMIILILRRNAQEKRGFLRGALTMALFMINAVFCIISIFSHWVFGYTSDNIFYRGPLGMLPFITAIAYICFMVVETITSLSKRVTGESIIVIMIAVLSVTGTILESVFQFDAMLNISCAIGIVFYYLFLHVSIYARDQLTNAYSRRIFYMDVEKTDCDDAVIVGLDMNYLKKINDEEGHAAGDKALITLTNVIQKNLYRGCTLYRVGGDEFMILCLHMTEEKAGEMMRIIRWDLDKTPYTFAYGIADYNREDGIEKATKEADDKMYRMKADMKAQRE